jgi:hypothetical protein
MITPGFADLSMEVSNLLDGSREEPPVIRRCLGSVSRSGGITGSRQPSRRFPIAKYPPSFLQGLLFHDQANATVRPRSRWYDARVAVLSPSFSSKPGNDRREGETGRS